MLTKLDSWTGTNDAQIQMNGTRNKFVWRGEVFCYGCLCESNSKICLSSPLLQLVTFTISEVTSPGRIHIFVFPETLDYLVQLAYDYLHSRSVCPDFRDPDILQLSSANVNMSLLLRYESLAYQPTSTHSGQQSTPIVIGPVFYSAVIPYSSRWSIFITHCSKLAGGTVAMSGSASFLNSYGHLDADQYPMLVYNSYLLPPILIVAIVVYVGLLLWYHRRHHFIQRVLPGLLILALIGCIARLAFFNYLNRTGDMPPMSRLALVCLPTIAFFAATRFLLYFVATGANTVVLLVPKAKILMGAAFAVFYGSLATLQMIFEIQKDPFQSLGPLVIAILQPVINIVYFIWIGHELSRTLTTAMSLKSKHQTKLFEQIVTIFQVCSALLTIFYGLHMMRFESAATKLWPVWWLLDFYGFLVYFGGVAFFMFFAFRPRRNNLIFHYSEISRDAEGNGEADNTETHPPRTPVAALELDYPKRADSSHSASKDAPSGLSANSQESLPPRRARKRREMDLSDAARRTMLLSSPFEDNRP